MPIKRIGTLPVIQLKGDCYPKISVHVQCTVFVFVRMTTHINIQVNNIRLSPT